MGGSDSGNEDLSGRCGGADEEVGLIGEVGGKSRIEDGAGGGWGDLEIVGERVRRVGVIGGDAGVEAVGGELHGGGAPGFGLIGVAVIEEDLGRDGLTRGWREREVHGLAADERGGRRVGDIWCRALRAAKDGGDERGGFFGRKRIGRGGDRGGLQEREVAINGGKAVSPVAADIPVFAIGEVGDIGGLGNLGSMGVGIARGMIGF